MSENVQAVETVVEEQAAVGFGEHLIGFLSGFMMGGFAYGTVITLVAIIHASEPPGWSVAGLFELLGLVAPEGVSLTGIPQIVFYPPNNAMVNTVVNIVLDYSASVAALLATIWGYLKVMSLDGEN